MMISEVLSKATRNKRRKRIGRGVGSGHGKTSGRGHKGQGQHSSDRPIALAEGGQMPLFRRLPKRGFSNAQFTVRYQVVNLADLDRRFADGTHVTPALLETAGLIRSAARPVKVLGTGELTRKLRVEATRFSASAARKITEAGGQATVMDA